MQKNLVACCKAKQFLLIFVFLCSNRKIIWWIEMPDWQSNVCNAEQITAVAKYLSWAFIAFFGMHPTTKERSQNTWCSMHLSKQKIYIAAKHVLNCFTGPESLNNEKSFCLVEIQYVINLNKSQRNFMCFFIHNAKNITSFRILCNWMNPLEFRGVSGCPRLLVKTCRFL